MEQEMEQVLGKGEADACWICLSEEDSKASPLEYACKCPRPVHLKCLARWQLQAAGQLEENQCRFCMAQLPAWQRTFLANEDVVAHFPIMAIQYYGRTYKLRVQPGSQGLDLFKRQVFELLSLDLSRTIGVQFECTVPGTTDKIRLNGLECYSAATYCAAGVAAERKRTLQRTHAPTTDTHPRTGSAAAPPPAQISEMTVPAAAARQVYRRGGVPARQVRTVMEPCLLARHGLGAGTGHDGPYLLNPDTPPERGGDMFGDVMEPRAVVSASGLSSETMNVTDLARPGSTDLGRLLAATTGQHGLLTIPASNTNTGASVRVAGTPVAAAPVARTAAASSSQTSCGWVGRVVRHMLTCGRASPLA